MKKTIRTGFVSNSSSSSFICELSNQAYAVSDGQDEDKITCSLCNKQMQLDNYKGWLTETFPDNSEQIIDTIIKEYGVELLRENKLLDESDIPKYFFGVDSIPSSLANIVCPFCSGKVVAFVDMYKYLLESSGLTEDEIKSKIVRPNKISINLIFPLA